MVSQWSVSVTTSRSYLQEFLLRHEAKAIDRVRPRVWPLPELLGRLCEGHVWSDSAIDDRLETQRLFCLKMTSVENIQLDMLYPHSQTQSNGACILFFSLGATSENPALASCPISYNLQYIYNDSSGIFIQAISIFTLTAHTRVKA